MDRSNLTRIDIEEEGQKLSISRETGHGAIPQVATQPFGHPGLSGVVSAPASAAMHSMPADSTGTAPGAAQGQAPAAGSAPAATAETDTQSRFIKSPMVGTFYRAPGPESPPFLEAGATVGRETVVCIIEAMKVMNEIQAETDGKIAEVLVENGAAVEFGQPLFKLA